MKKWRVAEPSAEYDALEVRVVLARKPGASKTKSAIGCSRDVFAVMAHASALPTEHIWVLALNTRNRVLGICDVASGGIAQAVVEPRDLLTPVMLAGAAAMVLVHNHPSGDPEPSSEDKALTRTISAAAALLGIRLLDHVIIGDGEFSSLADRGDL